MISSYPDKILILSITIVLTATVDSLSQTQSIPKRDYINNNMVWGSLGLQGKIKNKLYYQFDLEYRRQSDPEHAADTNTQIGKGRYNFVKNPYQLAFRPWLLYQLNQNAIFAVSPLCWFGTWSSPVNAVTYFQPEFRTSFQVTLNHTIGRIVISNRYRYELRFFGTKVIDDTRSPFGIGSSYSFPQSNRQGRARYMFKASVPLNTKAIEKGTYYLMANTEILLRIGKNVKNENLLDQYRINLSVGWKFRDDLRLEVGYLNMIAFRFNNQAKNNIDVNNIILLKLIFDNFNNYLPSDD